ncbi:DUF885 domain-containing protein [Actinomyces sp. zg-332]|uniref:DUF885 domain-containing protein n=1 Tax=Actinomyces sp. zg-332 TaxID=2708340 RepID=UPI00141E32E3|nr:DUF885 domain-containing protein [Actinomyces sp. zg-332]QPK93807.1 DUF885 domain-containing protein [Actinomyces sp. zg-332]
MTKAPKNTKLDQIAEEYVDNIAKNNPIEATYLGIKGYDHLWPDFSPSGLEKTNKLHLYTLEKAKNVELENVTDEITLKAMEERISLYNKLYVTGEQHRSLNNIESPLQAIRDIFDLQSQETQEDFEKILTRLQNIDQPLQGYIESLQYAKNKEHVSAKRQIEAVCKQIDNLASSSSSLDLLEQTYSKLQNCDSSFQSTLKEAIQNAKCEFNKLKTYMQEELIPLAPQEDAVGLERYKLLSQYHVGAVVDLDETYEWGQEELNNIDKQQKEIAKELYGDNVSVMQALNNLNNEPRYILHGTKALQEWMQKTADEAIQKLKGTHFDIDPRIETIECCIAPSSSGGIYYTGPSEDFTRPGRMWWSVPQGEDKFVTWQEKTTVYHEGVPGHHLQVGQTICLTEQLNRWRRLACWISGHGEGWALYSEQLMDELGYLNDPGERMGMLDAQRLRASRVVLDIGVHLKKKAPSQYGDKLWDSNIAWQFLKDNVAMNETFLHFEWERYLGWAGQAPSYKIGQRLWLQAREEYLRTASGKGMEPTMKAFHKKALNIGSLSLDIMKEALQK